MSEENNNDKPLTAEHVELSGELQPNGLITVSFTPEQYQTAKESLDKVFKDRTYMRNYVASKRGTGVTKRNIKRKAVVVLSPVISPCTN